MATQPNTSFLNKGIPTVEDAFVIIVKTEWNTDVVNELDNGCKRIFDAAGIRYQTLLVPGAVEIPFAIQAHANSSMPKADAYIALGTVVRGDTPHFEYVCQSVTQGITQLNVQLNSPTIFGILTVNTQAQALERIGGIHGHKGEEAAITAIKMIALKNSFTHVTLV